MSDTRREFDDRHREDHHVQEILDLFAEDSWLNVDAGEFDVRPPGAPTIRPSELGRPDSPAAPESYNRAAITPVFLYC
jgi:hypothetical protein